MLCFNILAARMMFFDIFQGCMTDFCSAEKTKIPHYGIFLYYTDSLWTSNVKTFSA